MFIKKGFYYQQKNYYSCLKLMEYAFFKDYFKPRKRYAGCPNKPFKDFQERLDGIFQNCIPENTFQRGIIIKSWCYK